VTEKKVLSDF
jgi:hypothetical protein